MPAAKPVLLASDVHYGATHPDQERAFLAWLDHAGDAASWIILNGDLFDFWFEYQWGVPRGYGVLLGRLRDIVTRGTPVTLMGGNHDWWGGRYLRDEIGLEFLQAPVVRQIAGWTAYLAHGDGLGAGDRGYKLLKVVLRNPLTRFAFSVLPIPVGDRLAGHVSNTEDRWNQWGERQRQRAEALESFAVQKLESEPELDLVLLGHTHRPTVRQVGRDRWYVNSGDWVYHQSYVALEPGQPPRLRSWTDETS